MIPRGTYYALPEPILLDDGTRTAALFGKADDAIAFCEARGLSTGPPIAPTKTDVLNEISQFLRTMRTEWYCDDPPESGPLTLATVEARDVVETLRLNEW